MRTLIPELCSLVFFYAIDTSSACTPLVLSQVCRRWRAIVFANPRLWLSLQLSLSNPCIPLVDFWFSKAASLPVSVSVFPGSVSPPVLANTNPFKQANSPGIKVLLPHLNRIQALHLHVHQSALGFLFARGTVSDMVHLESLSVQHHGYILDENEIGRLHAPKLRILHLSDPSPLLSLLADAILSVHTLTIDRVEFWEYPRRVPELLSSCPELQTLSIVFPRNLYLASNHLVALPSVTRLALEWCFPCNPISFFGAMLAPRLCSLSLTHANCLAAFSQEALTALQNLIQSSPLLTTLELVRCNLTSISEMSTLFFDAPVLQELSLVDCHGTGRLLSDFTPAEWEPPSTWLCPKLQRINVTGIRDNDVRSLISFVRRRMKTPDVTERGHYITELSLDSRIQDFTAHGRLLILKGLSIIAPFVKVIGPLDHIQEHSPFSSPVPKN